MARLGRWGGRVEEFGLCACLAPSVKRFAEAVIVLLLVHTTAFFYEGLSFLENGSV